LGPGTLDTAPAHPSPRDRFGLAPGCRDIDRSGDLVFPIRFFPPINSRGGYFADNGNELCIRNLAPMSSAELQYTKPRLYPLEYRTARLPKCRVVLCIDPGVGWIGQEGLPHGGSKEYAMHTTPTALCLWQARSWNHCCTSTRFRPRLRTFNVCYVYTHSLSRVCQVMYIRLQPGKSISICRYRMSRKRVCEGGGLCVRRERGFTKKHEDEKKETYRASMTTKPQLRKNNYK